MATAKKPAKKQYYKRVAKFNIQLPDIYRIGGGKLGKKETMEIVFGSTPTKVLTSTMNNMVILTTDRGDVLTVHERFLGA